MMFFPIPLLIALMTYMKRKKMYIAAAGIAIAALLRYIGVMAGVIASVNSGNEEMVMLMVLCLSLAVFCIATKISWKFNHDAMYSMKDEQEIQKIIIIIYALSVCGKCLTSGTNAFIIKGTCNVCFFRARSRLFRRAFAPNPTADEPRAPKNT